MFTLQLKRGLEDTVLNYKGPAGEIVVDSLNWNLHIQDNVVYGGHVIGSNQYTANAPFITSPASAASQVPTTPVITSSTYTGDGTHVASYWQIASDADFVNIVVDSGRQTTALTSYDVATSGVTLGMALTYYVRVRYESSAGIVSDWSSPTTFTTLSEWTTSYTTSHATSNTTTYTTSYTGSHTTSHTTSGTTTYSTSYTGSHTTSHTTSGTTTYSTTRITFWNTAITYTDDNGNLVNGTRSTMAYEPKTTSASYTGTTSYTTSYSGSRTTSHTTSGTTTYTTSYTGSHTTSHTTSGTTTYSTSYSGSHTTSRTTSGTTTYTTSHTTSY